MDVNVVKLVIIPDRANCLSVSEFIPLLKNKSEFSLLRNCQIS